MKTTFTTQEIETLVINADACERFGGLRQREANAFQRIGFANGCGIQIVVDDDTIRTYAAVVLF